MAITVVRLGAPWDQEQLARMRHALWPESTVEEHSAELTVKLAGNSLGTTPEAVLVSEADDGTLVGFLEVGLRSHADGCDVRVRIAGLPRNGIGTQLLAAAQDWARGQGCIEMASDTQWNNHLSQRVHEALGFEITERSINFRKKL